MTFASDLQTQSRTAPLTYIFYASAATFTSGLCSKYPRICNYPLMSNLEVSLELDTSSDRVYFNLYLAAWNNQWFGMGMGEMDTQNSAVMFTNTPSPISSLIKEVALHNHIPSPA
eukprot:337740_1